MTFVKGAGTQASVDGGKLHAMLRFVVIRLTICYAMMHIWRWNSHRTHR
jgi:ammonia channel protein AmtB